MNIYPWRHSSPKNSKWKVSERLKKLQNQVLRNFAEGWTFGQLSGVDCTHQQGRIHGQYQLQTGGQGRKCVFSHFSTRA